MSLETTFQRDVIDVELKIYKSIKSHGFHKTFRALDRSLGLPREQSIDYRAVEFKIIRVCYFWIFSLGNFTHSLAIDLFLKHVAKLNEELMSIVLLRRTEFILEKRS